MPRDAGSVDRLYSLDVMRGLAAMSVVLWHWQHFFFNGTTPGSIEAARLPFYDWLFPFYERGWLGVDFFFALSGFVFHWLYSARVASGAVHAREFALLRFSRLYPLHLVTLLIVAAGQYWSFRETGSFYVDPYNDLRHFLLNLAFASSWGLEQGHSFNASVWSVSVEVLLYALFFVACRKVPLRASVLAALSAAGFLFAYRVYQPVGQGIGSFFLGGCAYLAYRAVLASPRASGLATGLSSLTACAWAATAVFCWLGGSAALRFDGFVGWALPRMLSYWPVLVLFPLTILSLALVETLRGPVFRRLAFLGDLSYSAYLLHFPLQLLLYVMTGGPGRDVTLYYSPWVMLLFFGVLLAASMASFHYLEMPFQRRLRKACLKTRPTDPVRTIPRT